MDVVVYVNDPLLTEDQLKSGNLITITAETLYSVPEAWNPTGTQYMYNVTLPFPLTEEVNSCCFLNNVLILTHCFFYNHKDLGLAVLVIANNSIGTLCLNIQW